MSNDSLTLLVLLALVISLVGAFTGVGAQRALTSRRRGAKDSPLPLDVAGLRGEVESLRRDARGALRHLAVVRYDAFGDMGGRLSWSLALVDDAGTGVVLTSIHGRSDARSYAKGLVGWESDQPLSPEEDAVVTAARTRGLGHAPVDAPTRAKVGRQAGPEDVETVTPDDAVAEQVEREVTVREDASSSDARSA